MEDKKRTVGYTESGDFRCLEDLQESRTLVISNLLTLDYCGSERCKPGYAFGPYVRENYVLHIITEGKGQLFVGDKVYLIGKNQAFLLRPGVEATYKADKEDPWVYYWVGFHGAQSEKLLSSMGFDYEDYVIDLHDAQISAGYINHILDCQDLTHAAYLKRSGYFVLFLSEIVEYAKVPVRKERLSEETYVEMAVSEIITNYNQEVSISQIAGKIGINRSYLSIIFKKHLSVSPQQFLVEYRLKKAASLLLETDLAIRAIASIVGYSDPLTFSKAFKKKYGISPRIFRENPPVLLRTEEKGDYTGKNNL